MENIKGFKLTGEFRKPLAGEWYASEGGKHAIQTTVNFTTSERHILVRIERERKKL